MKPNPAGMAALPDNELLRLHQAGDQAAFGVLMERYSKKLRRNIYFTLPRPLQHSETVDDIVQNTCLKALIALGEGRYTGESDKFSGWIWIIARNECIDAGRRLKKRHTLPLTGVNEDGKEFDFEIEAEGNPEDAFLKKETAASLWEYVQELEPEQRDVVMLRYFSEYSYKEIMACLGPDVSENTYLGRTRYGLMHLRRKLAQQIKTEV